MLVMGCVMGLCACGSESADATEAPVNQTAHGRFEVETIRWEDGAESTGAQLQEQLDLMGGETFVELYDDATALLCLYGTRSDMKYSDTEMWHKDNENVSFNFSVNDGRVTLEQGGTTFIFLKK